MNRLSAPQPTSSSRSSRHSPQTWQNPSFNSGAMRCNSPIELAKIKPMAAISLHVSGAFTSHQRDEEHPLQCNRSIDTSCEAWVLSVPFSLRHADSTAKDRQSRLASIPSLEEFLRLKQVGQNGVPTSEPEPLAPYLSESAVSGQGKKEWGHMHFYSLSLRCSLRCTAAK